VKFVLKAHPGVEAPLGWSLSPAAQQDLVDQLSFVGTQGSFQTVEEWLRPGNLGCVSPS
jgi:hypothetical protein